MKETNSRFETTVALIEMRQKLEEVLTSANLELNDAVMRQQMTSWVANRMEPFRKDRRIKDYKVVCDETNNTPETIDNHRMNVDIYVQPMRMVEFITIHGVISRTGVSFDSLNKVEVEFKTETEAYLHRLGYESTELPT